METRYLPSTYIKYWWSYKLLDPRNKLDELIMIFTLIQIAYKVVNYLNTR